MFCITSWSNAHNRLLSVAAGTPASRVEEFRCVPMSNIATGLAHTLLLLYLGRDIWKTDNPLRKEVFAEGFAWYRESANFGPPV